MPVLSKRLAWLLQGPGPAWAEVLIEASKEFPGDMVPDTGAMAVWFSRRAGSVTLLRIIDVTPKLSAALLATVLTTQSASLRQLEIFIHPSVISAADVAVLVALPALEQLSISLRGGDVAGWRDRGTIIKTVSRLPALKAFIFHPTNTRQLPAAVELAALQSPSLTRLKLYITTRRDDEVMIFGALPALVSCELRWFSSTDARTVQVTPASFRGAPGLIGLSLSSESGQGFEMQQLQLAPSCFKSLSRLAALSLVKCGLTAVPAALVAAKQTLERLDLGGNPELQLDQAGVDTLLQLSALKSLSLKTEKQHWTVSSTRCLAKFLGERHRLRPGAPPLELSI